MFCFSVMVAGTVMNSTLAKQNEDSSVRIADLFVFTLERLSLTFTANGKRQTFAVCLQLSVQ